jgi:hypothetical protein
MEENKMKMILASAAVAAAALGTAAPASAQFYAGAGESARACLQESQLLPYSQG